MVAEHPGFHFQRCVLTQPQHIQLVFAYINANKCHLSIPPLVYAASSRLGRARIPYRLRERSEPDLRRRVIALRSATGLRPTKVLVANQHSGRDTRSTASVRSEGKPIHRARPVRTRGGCSNLLSVAGQTVVETLFIKGVLAVVFTGPAAFGVGLEAAFEIFREIFQTTGIALAFRYGVGRHRLNEVCLLVFPQAGKEVDDTDYNGRPYQPADDSAAKGLFRFFLGDSALVNTIHDILHCSYCWSS